MDRRQRHRALTLLIRMLALGGAIFLLLLPLEASAADVQAGNVTQNVPAGTTITDDLYVFGSGVTVAGTVDGNLIAAGGTVTISGHVTKDVMVAGGTVDISGPVDGSIRVAGGTVTVSGPVSGDIVAATGTLNVNAGATVGRDLLLGAGQSTIAAPIARNVNLGSGNVTIENSVGGNVTGAVGQLTLANGAKIGGYLDYTSSQTASIQSGASVAGSVNRHTPPNDTPAIRGFGFLTWLRGWIGISFLGLLLVLLFPQFSNRAADTLVRRPGASVGYGAVLLVVTPIVGIVAFIVGLLIGGWWLALLLMPAYVLALALGYVVTGYWLGRWASNSFSWHLHPAVIVVGGLFVLSVITAIPVLGWLVGFLAAIFGLGALAVTLTTRSPAGQTIQKVAA